MRERVLASLQTTAAMIALPCGYALLQQFGPSSRVVFWPYLPTAPAEWLLVTKALPQITRDLGRVDRLAPTGADKHSFAREMDGDDLRFTLEVVGAKGTGTLRADCTISGDRVLDWRSGVWRFQGKATRIDSVPGQ